MSAPGIVIAGGGLAAQRCAETLRSPRVRGSDPHRLRRGRAPHTTARRSRREFCAVSSPTTRCRFREPGWYAENAVELLLGRRAVGLERPSAGSSSIAARTSPTSELRDRDRSRAATSAGSRRFSNALPLRSLDDVARLRAELGAGARLAIIGAGFIGQEVAATARGLGAEVTVIEALDLPLVGVLGTRVSRWLVDMHRDEGVRMLLASRLAGAAGNGRVERLELESGGPRSTLRRGHRRGRRRPRHRLAGRGRTRARRDPHRSAGPHQREPRLRRRRRRGAVRPVPRRATCAPNTGTPQVGRALPSPARSSAIHPAPPRRRAFGATNTGSASSTPGRRREPTGCASTATSTGATSPCCTAAADARSERSQSDAHASSPPCGACSTRTPDPQPNQGDSDELPADNR